MIDKLRKIIKEELANIPEAFNNDGYEKVGLSTDSYKYEVISEEDGTGVLKKDGKVIIKFEYSGAGVTKIIKADAKTVAECLVDVVYYMSK